MIHRAVFFLVFLGSLCLYTTGYAQDSIPDYQAIAAAYKTQSATYRDNGEYTLAQSYLDSALHVLKKGGDGPKWATAKGWAWANKGFISSHYQGRILEAKEAYHKAAGALEKGQADSLLIARHVYKSLGNIFTRLGEYAHARERLQQVLDLATLHNDKVLCVESCNDLAIALLEDHDQATSIQLLEQYLPYADPGSLQQGLLQSNLARALYESGNPATAKSVNEEAIRCFSQLLEDEGRNHQHRDAQNYLLGCHIIGLYIAGQQGATDRVHQHAIAGEALAEGLFGENPHRKRAKYWLALGTAQLDLGQADTALEAFRTAFQTLTQLHQGKNGLLYAEQLLIGALHGQIQCFSQQLRNGGPAHLADSVFHRFDQLFVLEAAVRSELLSGISRTDHVGQFHNLGCKAVQFALQEHRKRKDPAALRKALDYVTYSQGILLAESMIKQIISKQYTTFRWEVLLNNEYEIACLRLNEDANEEELYKAHLLKAHYMEDLKAHYPLLYDQWFAPATRDLNHITAQYEHPDRGLLVFFDLGDSLVQFLVSQKGIQYHMQPFDSRLMQQIAHFGEVVQTPTSTVKAFKESGYQLYNKLLAPMAADLPSHLTVIPDGRMHTVAFPLLVTDTATAHHFGQLAYVMHEFAIHYVPSLSFLHHEQEQLVYEHELLLVAPDFSCDTALASLPMLDEALPGASLVYKGGKATASVFLKQSGTAQIAHLATHGFGVPDNTNASWIALADTTACRHERLHFDQIREQTFWCDLLLLQACQSGSGALLDGEGASSMSHGFLHAGCHNVMATAWNANPDATSQVIAAFYNQLNEDDLAGALRAAQLTYLNLDATDALSAHPYYWGGLHVYGTNKMVGSVPAAAWGTRTLVGILALLALILAGWFWLRKPSRFPG